ncbi:MAG: hypothetical protein KAQ64_03485 [Candidatus Pacebacteria bacterium]|nr:hypothetical protein [Candidatus Paceibacterota bacterium]
MRNKSLLIVALLISSSLFLSGCIRSDISTDEMIILNSQTPTFEVPVVADGSSVEWYLDGKLAREDDVDENQMAYYLLDRDDFQVGRYVLKAKDIDSSLEWEFTVHHDVSPNEALETKEESSSAANERGYDHFTDIQKRHEKAREYWDKQ